MVTCSSSIVSCRHRTGTKEVRGTCAHHRQHGTNGYSKLKPRAWQFYFRSIIKRPKPFTVDLMERVYHVLNEYADALEQEEAETKETPQEVMTRRDEIWELVQGESAIRHERIKELYDVLFPQEEEKKKSKTRSRSRSRSRSRTSGPGAKESKKRKRSRSKSRSRSGEESKKRVREAK